VADWDGMFASIATIGDTYRGATLVGGLRVTGNAVATSSGPMVIVGGTLLEDAGGDWTGTVEFVGELNIPPTNTAPMVTTPPALSVDVGQPLTLAGSATDDGWPHPPGTVTYLWSLVAGPDGAVISDATMTTTTVTFASAGVYTLRLEASDSDLVGSSDTIVTVTQPSSEVLITEDTIMDADDLGPNDDLVVDGATLTLIGDGAINSLRLVNGAKLTHPPATETTAYRLKLTVSGSVEIDDSSSIDVSGCGYLQAGEAPWPSRMVISDTRLSSEAVRARGVRIAPAEAPSTSSHNPS
jgi:hypothetical protein